MSGMGDLMVMLPAMLLMNKIDFTDPFNLMLVRTAFIAVQVAILGAIALMYLKITGANNKKKIKVPPPPAFGQPPVPESQWEEKTIMEYDLMKLQQYGQEVLMHSAIVGFMHYKFEMVPPLFLQAVMNPMRFYKNKLVQSVLFGWTGPELERPFKEDPPPFANLLGGAAEEPAATEAVTQAEDVPGTIREISDEEPKGKEVKKAIKKATEEVKEEVAQVVSGSGLNSIDDIDEDSEIIQNDEVPSEDLLLDE